MAGMTNAQVRGGPSATRIFGVETEYPFVELDADQQRLDPAKSADTLMRTVKKLVPHLRCAGEHDVFTVNGSRVYVDIGLHPEVATPECSTPEEAVLFMRAGDRLLAQAARTMESAWANRGREVEAVFWKANVDHRTKATWGSHESYLHKAPQSLFAEQLISHLVTRIIYTGAGGFDNRASALRFVVSPRASHLEHTVSSDSTHARGVFHTRDVPLAAPPNRRLHVLAGESLWSETADYLRIGTTALLVAQIDAGRQPQTDLDLASPTDALATIAADVGCTVTVKLRSAGLITAIAIQRRLLENVEADLGAEHLPAWAPSVCERWRHVLDCLEASPPSLVGVLDWPTKLAILKRQCEADALQWTFSSQTAGGLLHNVSARIHRTSETEVIARLLDGPAIHSPRRLRYLRSPRPRRHPRPPHCLSRRHRKGDTRAAIDGARAYSRRVCHAPREQGLGNLVQLGPNRRSREQQGAPSGRSLSERGRAVDTTSVHVDASFPGRRPDSRADRPRNRG